MKFILGILLCLFTLCLADDSLFEPGTPENPKEDLPYNDDVMVKTLVFLLIQVDYSICLKTALTWLWTEIRWECTTLFSPLLAFNLGIFVQRWKEIRFLS